MRNAFKTTSQNIQSIVNDKFRNRVRSNNRSEISQRAEIKSSYNVNKYIGQKRYKFSPYVEGESVPANAVYYGNDVVYDGDAIVVYG